MRALGRIALALVAVALLALGAAAWLLPRWLEADAFRELLVGAARDATGRDVAWDDLSLALFPPRLVATQLRVGDAAAPLVLAERADLRIAVAPLLARVVLFDSLALEGVTWRVVRSANGVELPIAKRDAPRAAAPSAAAPPAPAGSNAPRATSASSGSGPALRFAVRSVALHRSRIVWDDRVATPPVSIEIRDVEGRAEGTSADAPADVSLDGTLASGGTLRVAGTAMLDGTLDLEATLEGVDLAPFSAYFGRDFALDGTRRRHVARARARRRARGPRSRSRSRRRESARGRRRGAGSDRARRRDCTATSPCPRATSKWTRRARSSRPTAAPSTKRARRAGDGERQARARRERQARRGRRALVDQEHEWRAARGARRLALQRGALRPEGLGRGDSRAGGRRTRRKHRDRRRCAWRPGRSRSPAACASTACGCAPPVVRRSRCAARWSGRARASRARDSSRSRAASASRSACAPTSSTARRATICNSTRENADARALLEALTGKPDLLEGPATIAADLAGPLGATALAGVAGGIDLAVGAGRIPRVSPLRAAVDGLAGHSESARLIDRERAEVSLAPYLGDRFESITGRFAVGGGRARTDALVLRYPGYQLELRGSVGLVRSEPRSGGPHRARRRRSSRRSPSDRRKSRAAARG